MITPFIFQAPSANSMIATLYIEEIKEYVVSDVFVDRPTCERWIRKQYGKAFASCVIRYVHQRKKAAELAGWPGRSAYVMEYLERELGNLEESPLIVILNRIQKVKDSLLQILPSEKSAHHRWREVITDVINQTESLQRALKVAPIESTIIAQS